VPTHPVKCKECSKVWLAQYEFEAALECPHCGASDPIRHNALLTAQLEVNGKQIGVDFPTEIGVGVVPDFAVGIGPQGFSLLVAGEFHTWPWGTVFKRMGVSD